jgi:hypothetical protein
VIRRWLVALAGLDRVAGAAALLWAAARFPAPADGGAVLAAPLVLSVTIPRMRRLAP